MNNQQKIFSVSNLGKFASEKFSASVCDYRTNHKQNWHSHDEFVLAMTLKGIVREEVRESDKVIEPFEIGVKSPDVRHTDHFCPKGVRVIRLTISSEIVSELKRNSLLNVGWYWLKNQNAIRPFLRVGQSVLSQQSETEDNIYEVIASLLEEKTLLKNPPNWLQQAKDRIDETFAYGVRLSDLADEANVHPVYFARKFRHFFGVTVGGYIRQKQFYEVHRLLLSKKYNLAQIAAEAGFSDQAHLTRTFANEFGITPANFRKLLS